MTPRLLVPDNERDLLYLYQLILEPEGYDVHVAASGFEQVTTIEHFQPDLLILDHHLSRRRDDAEPLCLSTHLGPSSDSLYCRSVRYFGPRKTS